MGLEPRASFEKRKQAAAARTFDAGAAAVNYARRRLTFSLAQPYRRPGVEYRAAISEMTTSFDSKPVRRQLFRALVLLLLSSCSVSPPVGGDGSPGGVAGAAESTAQGGKRHTDAGKQGAGDSGKATQAGSPPDDEWAADAGSSTSPGGHGGLGGTGATGATGATGGTAADVGGGGSGPSAGSADNESAGQGGSEEREMVPCDVYAAYAVCRNCHVDPPRNGAPMPLLSLLDLQTFAKHEYRVISSGEMPAVGMLSADESTLILDWLSAGAQGVPQTRCPE